MSDPLATRLALALGPAYEVGSLLGRGGMGAVYRATDRRLRREVAIKVLPPELGYSADLRARFVREAQMAAQLSHPNIVPIYDVGERVELVWFVMAFVEGESVRAKVEREGPQPISVVRRVLQEVAQALAYAHAKGVIHRDIKPDNIMLDRGSGRAMVTDFGIAKALSGEESELTRPGEVVGTARYMAPEQALAEGAVDARADMYALGLVGYFLLTGQHAIKGTSLPAVIAEHVKGVALDLTAIDRRLPAPLVQAITRCLAANPDGRFARMEELADALRELGGDLPDTPPPVRRLLRESERIFVIATMASFALGLIGVERVPPSLLLLLGGAAAGQWVMAIEQATRRRVTWSMIRRALYVERVRRVEEAQEAGVGHPGLAFWVAMVGLIIGGLALAGPLAVGSGPNVVLFYGGVFGGLVAAKVFGLPRRRSTTRRRRLQIAAAGLGLAFLAVMVYSVSLARRRVPAGVVGGLAAGLVAAVVVIVGVAVFRKRRRTAVPRAVPDAEPVQEWRVPRWLDVAGSWLFGRFARDGWRVRFEREKPAAVAAAHLGVSAARQAAKRISDLVVRISGTGTAAAHEAQRLARDLVAECRRAEQDLKPLLAKIARLGEGVLVSRTIAAGGSVESELDRAEHEADALRAHARECGEMLDGLAVGLEAVARGQDTRQLDAALQRARELSSGVRRAILRAEAT